MGKFFKDFPLIHMLSVGSQAQGSRDFNRAIPPSRGIIERESASVGPDGGVQRV